MTYNKQKIYKKQQRHQQQNKKKEILDVPQESNRGPFAPQSYSLPLGQRDNKTESILIKQCT